MPGCDDSVWKAAGAGLWHAAQQLACAVAAIGLLAHTATGQEISDPAVARLLRELQAGEYDAVTLSRAQARAGDLAAARATLQRAIAQAREARDLLAIERGQADMGDRDLALKTLLSARKSDLIGARLRNPRRPSVDGVGEPADPDHDSRVANRHIPETLAEIAIEQSRLGDRVAAGATFEQAMRAAKALVPDDRSFEVTHVIWARSKAGDFDGALNEVAAIADRAERFDALTQINLRDQVVDMKSLARIIQMVEAYGFPPKLPDGSSLSEGWVTNLRIEPLIAMARAQAAANDRAEASKTLGRARQIAENLEESEERYSWLGAIARALVKIGDAAEASRMADAIGKTERNWKWQVLTGIAEAHAEIGDPATRTAWEDALRAAETGRQKLRVLFEIAAAQTKAGDREAALRTLGQALVVGRGQPPGELLPFGDLDGLEAQIAEARAEAGDIAGAIRLSDTIEHNQLQGAALAGIASVQAASGDIKGALDTTGRIRPPDPRQGFINHLRDQWSAMHKIITAQARAGDVAGALAKVDRLGPSPEWRRLGMLWIAEGIGQRNDVARHAQPPRVP